MVAAHVEYLDFTAGDATRVYRLRVRRGTEFHAFTVAIPNEAFLSGRVRYQDAPDICFIKVQQELAAREAEGIPPARALSMSDQELEEYRVSHAPKNPGRRY
jgi:hypothetical protein